MKEEKTKTKSKKKIFYYVALAVCVLLLVTATVLTVYFVTGSDNLVVENPPVTDLTDPEQPAGPSEPVEPENSDEPDDPTGGDQAVSFVVPVSYESATAFNDVVWEGYCYTRHKAVDFAAEANTPVYAMADGTVIEISLDSRTGNYIDIRHADGLTTRYRFVEPETGLKEGDAVLKGEQIAVVAEAYGSEKDMGTHLHLEVKLNGEYADPAEYLDIVSSEK